MSVAEKLPDFLEPELTVVFCGTAVGARSAARGHYYAGTGNEFWRYLHEAGFTSRRLRPEEDSRVVEYGIGLTDLAKRVASSSDRGLDHHLDVDGFVFKIDRYEPRWVAFHGKPAARAVSRAFGHGRNISYGTQAWNIGGTQIFVVPSASGANREPTDPDRRLRRLEGKQSRLEWFRELHDIVVCG